MLQHSTFWRPGLPGRAASRCALALLVARAGAALVGARLALRPPRRHTARLLAGVPPTVERASSRAPSGRAERAVDAAVRRLPGSWTCLERALALRHLLAQDGVTARLRIGVARDGGGCHRFHAWLERDGHLSEGVAESAGFVPMAPRA